MNCKQGDLAVIVSARNKENVGLIVRCLRFAGEISESVAVDIWEVDRPVKWVKVSGDIVTRPYATDANLRPLRPNDGEDETLTWAGKPQKVTA